MCYGVKWMIPRQFSRSTVTLVFTLWTTLLQCSIALACLLAAYSLRTFSFNDLSSIVGYNPHEGARLRKCQPIYLLLLLFTLRSRLTVCYTTVSGEGVVSGTGICWNTGYMRWPWVSRLLSGSHRTDGSTKQTKSPWRSPGGHVVGSAPERGKWIRCHAPSQLYIVSCITYDGMVEWLLVFRLQRRGSGFALLPTMASANPFTPYLLLQYCRGNYSIRVCV